jgi:hypothetical protein
MMLILLSSTLNVVSLCPDQIADEPRHLFACVKRVFKKAIQFTNQDYHKVLSVLPCHFLFGRNWTRYGNSHFLTSYYLNCKLIKYFTCQFFERIQFIR